MDDLPGWTPPWIVEIAEAAVPRLRVTATPDGAYDRCADATAAVCTIARTHGATPTTLTGIGYAPDPPAAYAAMVGIPIGDIDPDQFPPADAKVLQVSHAVPVVDHICIDFTARQFDPDLPWPYVFRTVDAAAAWPGATAYRWEFERSTHA